MLDCNCKVPEIWGKATAWQNYPDHFARLMAIPRTYLVRLETNSFHQISITAEFRIDIFPLSVNKCVFTDKLSHHGAAEVSFQSAQPTKWSF